MEVQEDADEATTARIPIVLAGLSCGGTEQSLEACPGLNLGQTPPACRHDADVHLVCSSRPNPGESLLKPCQKASLVERINIPMQRTPLRSTRLQ